MPSIYYVVANSIILLIFHEQEQNTDKYSLLFCQKMHFGVSNMQFFFNLKISNISLLKCIQMENSTNLQGQNIFEFLNAILKAPSFLFNH